MQKITRAEALRMVEEAFAVAPSSLTEDTAREDLQEWDSMGALMLMAELDSRFGIVLSPEDSKAMAYVRDVLDFLHTRGCLAA